MQADGFNGGLRPVVSSQNPSDLTQGGAIGGSSNSEI